MVNELIKNGLKIYESDINLFKKIFVEKLNKDLILIQRAYNELNKKSLNDAIKPEAAGKKKENC